MWLLGKIGGGQAGKDFPYEIGEVVTSFDNKSLWTLHEGTKKADKSKVSIFSFNLKTSSPDKADLARNGLRRLKTLRHPTVLTYLDGVELDSVIYIATEHVRPLEEVVREVVRESKQAVSWGLYTIIKGLVFLHERKLAHGNVNINSIFVDKAGEWKLSGLEFVSEIPFKDENGEAALKRFSSYLPHKYKSPEILGQRWSSIDTAPVYSTDAWGLGCLLYEIFEQPLQRAEDLKSAKQVPPKLRPYYQRLLSENTKTRLDPAELLHNEFFENSFVETQLFIENLALKDQREVDSFLERLPENLDSFPKENCKYKILPKLLVSMRYGSGGSKALLPILQIGKSCMTDEEYKVQVLPGVVELFSSNDRALRMQLLQNLPKFADQLSNSVVSEKIYPQVAAGFMDTSPALREATVKSMVHLVPKMNPKLVNDEVVKHLWRLQTDQEPGIRTNTTIALGYLANHFDEQTRKRVLIPGFTRALKDPFPPTRLGALMALSATQEHYTGEESATKILPAISFLLVDQQRDVRNAAFQCLSILTKKLEKYSEEMTAMAANAAAVASASGGANGPASRQGANSTNNDSSEASGYMSWALSLKNKIYKSDHAAPPPPPPTASPTPTTSSASAYKPPVVQPQKPQQYSTDSNNSSNNNNNNSGVGASKPMTLSERSAGGKPSKITSCTVDADEQKALDEEIIGLIMEMGYTRVRVKGTIQKLKRNQIPYDMDVVLQELQKSDPKTHKTASAKTSTSSVSTFSTAAPKLTTITSPSASSASSSSSSSAPAPAPAAADDGWDDWKEDEDDTTTTTTYTPSSFSSSKPTSSASSVTIKPASRSMSLSSSSTAITTRKNSYDYFDSNAATTAAITATNNNSADGDGWNNWNEEEDEDLNPKTAFDTAISKVNLNTNVSSSNSNTRKYGMPHIDDNDFFRAPTSNKITTATVTTTTTATLAASASSSSAAGKNNGDDGWDDWGDF